MRQKQAKIFLLFTLVFVGLTSFCQTTKDNEYLISFMDTVNQEYGYKNQKGEIVIPLGRYSNCYTDTFRIYAIVAKPQLGFVAIDRHENILYTVLPFDNGPDYSSEGLFRIIENNKIGYADSRSGKIIIKPQYDCAWPFENGAAKVSIGCNKKTEGEITFWLSDHWLYIDKSGKIVDKPKSE